MVARIQIVQCRNLNPCGKQTSLWRNLRLLNQYSRNIYGFYMEYSALSTPARSCCWFLAMRLSSHHDFRRSKYSSSTVLRYVILGPTTGLDKTSNADQVFKSGAGDSKKLRYLNISGDSFRLLFSNHFGGTWFNVLAR